MPTFQSNSKPDVVVTVSDREEVQMCPKCTFPNNATARVCVDCGYPLQDGTGRWIPAKLIQKCTNPECSAFVCIKDSKCKKCGASTTEPVDNQQTATPIDTPERMSTYVLICPNCDTHNPANAENCSSCGFSLEDVDPTDEEEQCKIIVQLENIRTQKRVSVTLKDGEQVMLGKKGMLSDQFANTIYVSGTHLYLSFNQGDLWIRDESRNGTYIDRARLDKGIDIPICSGTVFGMGDVSASCLNAAFFKLTF